MFWKNLDGSSYRLWWISGPVCWGSGCSSWKELQRERRCAGTRSSDWCRGGWRIEPARTPVGWCGGPPRPAGRLGHHRWHHRSGWGCGSVHEHPGFCCCPPAFQHATPVLLRMLVALRGEKWSMENMKRCLNVSVKVSAAKLPAWPHPNLDSLTHTIQSRLEGTFLILTRAESS